ncbi:MAG: type II toxin-antitoxin system RelE/ParE family toxin [Patescibacteria group bacterium]
MATYEVVYSDLVVTEDIPRLGASDRSKIEAIIRVKLTTLPDQFGKPLRRPRHGYWTLRIGTHRLVYAISSSVVRVIAILNRDRVYEELTKRLDL